MTKVHEKLFPLPWWSHFIGYALTLGVVVGCTYAVVGFGGAMGEYVATQWLIAMTIGIFKSVLVIQPIKVRLRQYTH